MRAPFGYTVMVDGVTIPMDLSWTLANQLCKFISMMRYAGDGRGVARCRHDGNDACFDAGRCLRIRSEDNRDGAIPSRPHISFHFDERPAHQWWVCDEDHDSGDEDAAAWSGPNTWGRES